MKTINGIIFWNVLIFLSLVLSLIFFPRYFGAEDYVLSYGLFVSLLIFLYSLFCFAAGIFFSVRRKKQTAQGFYLSAFVVFLLGIPSCYGGIFLRSAAMSL